jgi:hypothetical protein
MDMFGIKPGRMVGHLLAAIQEAQAIGEVHDREEALHFARNWMKQHSAAQGSPAHEGEG